MTLDDATIDRRIEDWVAAETTGDRAALDALAHEDMVLVGPFGYVLDRDAWLGRYHEDGLVTRSLAVTERRVRLLGPTAVVVGLHEQTGTYAGRPNDGRYRATQIWTADDEGPRLAGLHLSPVAEPGAR